MLKQLQQLEKQGTIRALDYQFARLLHSLNPDPLLTLTAANVSYELGQGNVCMALSAPKLFGLNHQNTLAITEQVGICQTRWADHLQSLPMVSDGNKPAPLVLDNGRLYLYRYWEYEKNVAHFLQHQSATTLNLKTAQTILQRLFQRDYHFVARQCQGLNKDEQKAAVIKWLDIERKETLNWPEILNIFNHGAEQTLDRARLDQLIPESACLNWQKIAAALAASRSFAVISGGPGTGKTTTVTRLLALLSELGTKSGAPNIKLVAPTGKAAARLTESIGGALANLNCSAEVRSNIPTQAGTVHRLLGVGRRGFVHNKDNRLHLDILVVDEASMIDLPLMSQLLAALPDHARLILLGDRNQLSSVEAGSVLGDICAAASFDYSPKQANRLHELTGHCLPSTDEAHTTEVSNNLCMLRKSYRFDAASGIGTLARAVNDGEPAAMEGIFSSGFNDIERYASADYSSLIAQCVKHYRDYLLLIRQSATDEESEKERILKAFNQFQLLCALREGPYGTSGLNNEVENALQQEGLLTITGQWYEGRPVLITRNDHGLGLYNGDIGITLRDARGKLQVAFGLADKSIRTFLPSRLPQHETVFAMTIHKSQGSEFANVAMVLPEKDYPLITRELVYTGITRAKSKLTLFCDLSMLKKAAKSPTERQSGLLQRLTTVNSTQENQPSQAMQQQTANKRGNASTP